MHEVNEHRDLAEALHDFGNGERYLFTVVYQDTQFHVTERGDSVDGNGLGIWAAADDGLGVRLPHSLVGTIRAAMHAVMSWTISHEDKAKALEHVGKVDELRASVFNTKDVVTVDAAVDFCNEWVRHEDPDVPCGEFGVLYPDIHTMPV